MIRRLIPAAIVALAFAAPSYAQDKWPDKPIRMIVPFTAGSFTDTAARAVGSELTTQFGQSVVV